MTTPMIRIRGLSKTFRLHQQGGATLNVLENVDLDVHAAECVVLDGPSGAGKSTLLKCIYANYLASAGSIEVRYGNDTVDVTRAPVSQLLQLRRHTLGYVSQFLRAIPRVPARDIVAEPLADLAGVRAEAQMQAGITAQQLLQRLRIPQHLWSLPPATFSGGEQQRVNIACSFARHWPVLLLDEPTASLDAVNRDTVIDMIREARAAGAAIVGIFHDPEVRNAVATRVVNLAAVMPALSTAHP